MAAILASLEMRALQRGHFQNRIFGTTSTSVGREFDQRDWRGSAHVSAGTVCRAADGHSARASGLSQADRCR